MPKEAIERLNFLCETIPNLLSGISETEFSYKPSIEKWSKKEILGHLIDSATNNHQRFVRAQFQDVPHIIYDQNNWNKFSFYQSMDSTHLINLWTVYNLHLVEIMKRIPAENLKRECQTESLVTIEWLIIDYVKHLEHHLKQLVNV